MTLLKPPEPLGADRFQAALTRRFLTPALAELEATFLALRAKTDRVLEAQAAARRDKPYPYGYCLEITLDVFAGLRAWSEAADSPGTRALKAFLKNGGEARPVWGVLRGRYFQNAMRLGALYVDVANDSVDPRKAKVEILPMEDSGLELVRDGAHFADIAESYWGVRAYANTALPSLAPLFPIILVDPEERVLLHSRASYMMRLFGSDGFRRSERWLGEGPPPPPHIVEKLRAACPEDIRAANRAFGAAAAVDACRKLRASGVRIDADWAEGMGALFDRVPSFRILQPQRPTQITPASNLSGAAIADMDRTNARPGAGIVRVAA